MDLTLVEAACRRNKLVMRLVMLSLSQVILTHHDKFDETNWKRLVDPPDDVPNWPVGSVPSWGWENADICGRVSSRVKISTCVPKSGIWCRKQGWTGVCCDMLQLHGFWIRDPWRTLMTWPYSEFVSPYRFPSTLHIHFRSLKLKTCRFWRSSLFSGAPATSSIWAKGFFGPLAQQLLVAYGHKQHSEQLSEGTGTLW